MKTRQTITEDHQILSFSIDDHELTTAQRKLYNFLLWRFFEATQDQTVYSVSIDFLNRHLNYQGESEKRILRACAKLSGIKFRWQLKTEDITMESGFAPLISQCWTDNKQLWYSFTPRLKSFLKKEQIFSLIELQIIDLLSNAYAQKFYHHLRRLTGIETDGWWEVDKLGMLLGLEGPEANFDGQALLTSIIEPSINEINAVSELMVQVQCRRQGSHISAFKFKVARKYAENARKCLRLPPVQTKFVGRQQVLEKHFEAYKAHQVCELTQKMNDEEMQDLQKAFLEHIKNNKLLMKKYHQDGFDNLSIKLNFEVFLEQMLLTEQQRSIHFYKQERIGDT